MKRTFKYYVPDAGETIAVACAVDVECWDAEDAAEEAAEEVHRDGDAGTWIDGSRRIVIVAEDGTETPFNVSVDYRPVFTARPVQT